MVQCEPKNLYRQVHEGVLIDTFSGDILLNRKGNGGKSPPPPHYVDRREGIYKIINIFEMLSASTHMSLEIHISNTHVIKNTNMLLT